MQDPSDVLQELLSDRDELIAELRADQGALYAQAQHTRLDIARLSAEAARLADALDVQARHARQLRDENAQTAARNEHLAAEVRGLEKQLGANRVSFEGMARDGKKLEAELRAALSELDARFVETRAEAEARVATAEYEKTQLLKRLTEQTNELVAQTRHEVRVLARLIDVVQSSKFWTFKRILRRLRGGTP